MHELFVTALFNRFLAAPANALLDALNIQHNPQFPFSDFIAMEILVTIILLVFFGFIRARLSAERPGGLQHMTEMLHGFIYDQEKELVGHDAGKFTAFLTALFLFILFCNLLGLVPAFESPTGNASVPLGLALITFVYYHFQGMKKQGPVHYGMHFFGPVWWLSPLMFFIEIISHCARVLSLTIRLWANIFAGDVVTLIFFSLIPIGLPVIFLLLHLGVSFLQAYIFMLLAVIYLAGAVATEEH